MNKNTEAQMWEATATDYLRLLLPLFAADERALFEGTGELPSRDLSDACVIEAQVRERVAREIEDGPAWLGNAVTAQAATIRAAFADAARIARGPQP